MPSASSYSSSSERTPLLTKSSPSAAPRLSALSWLSRHIYFLVVSLLLTAFLLYFIFFLLVPYLFPPVSLFDSHSQFAAICNPFAFKPRPSIDFIHSHGLFATISIFPPSLQSERSSASSLSDYSSYSVPLNQSFYFSCVNTPTRKFTETFRQFDSNHQQFSIAGQYFYLEALSELKLSESENDQLGFYQMALIADDGATLEVATKNKEKVKYSLFVDNDGIHQSKFVSSRSVVQISSYSTRIPIRIRFFQGAPDHICLVLLWRFIGQTKQNSLIDGMIIPLESLATVSAPSEVVEGLEGNELFYSISDPNQVGQETEKTRILKQHGWRVVNEQNFFLPEEQAKQIHKQMKEERDDPCQVQEENEKQQNKKMIGNNNGNIHENMIKPQ